jgi:hypothetical protein
MPLAAPAVPAEESTAAARRQDLAVLMLKRFYDSALIVMLSAESKPA